MELVLEEKGVEKRVRVGNIFIGGVGSGEVRRVQGRFVDGGKKGRKGVRRGLGLDFQPNSPWGLSFLGLSVLIHCRGIILTLTS